MGIQLIFLDFPASNTKWSVKINLEEMSILPHLCSSDQCTSLSSPSSALQWNLLFWVQNKQNNTRCLQTNWPSIVQELPPVTVLSCTWLQVWCVSPVTTQTPSPIPHPLPQILCAVSSFWGNQWYQYDQALKFLCATYLRPSPFWTTHLVQKICCSMKKRN